MTPEPESQTPDAQPAEKPRPYASDGGQARAESELWELEQEATRASEEPAGNREPENKRRESVRKWVAGPLEKQADKKKTLVRLGIQPRGMIRPTEQIVLPARGVEKEFSQLDDWEDGAVSTTESPVGTDMPAPLPGEAAGLQPPESVEVAVNPAEEMDTPQEVIAPAPPPVVNEPVPMRRIEWAGLLLFAVLIAGLATGAYFWSIHQLPKETPRWQKVMFPVKGQRVEIKNAATYWRTPVLEGAERDPIRRGTRLIPVVDLEIGGGPAAVRVIFRDEEGRGVGDPIIRQVDSPGRLSMAATAGFEDPGMHAAYRTEELDPWSVEVSEAAGAGAAGGDFSLVLKMNVSSDLR